MSVPSRQPSGPAREKSAHNRHESGTAPHAFGEGLPFSLAAPSFVIPAGVADNARFLAPHFAEIGLLFFETEACLAYTDADLPRDLDALPVSWHVHLPLDLPWAREPEAALDAISGLMQKTAFLKPRVWVLHPPAKAGMLTALATRLRDQGANPADFLLENVEESDLRPLWDEARSTGFSTCLDLGHIMAYGQHPVLELPGLWETVRMLHVNGPGPGGRHASLTTLDRSGRDLLRTMLRRFCGETITIEVFDEIGLFESASLLRNWITEWKEKK
jgi:hypothetical protein